MKVKELYKKASDLKKTIVFPEASFSDRTLEAVKYIQKKKIARPILIGDESALVIRDKSLMDFHIINPKTFQNREDLVKRLYEKRKDKGMTMEEAEKLALDPYYFATLLVDAGFASTCSNAEYSIFENSHSCAKISKRISVSALSSHVAV